MLGRVALQQVLGLGQACVNHPLRPTLTPCAVSAGVGGGGDLGLTDKRMRHHEAASNSSQHPTWSQVWALRRVLDWNHSFFVVEII